MRDGLVTLFLCGDVMTGRGVDQILPHPGDPRLWEASVRDARTYVELAEAVNGPIPHPVGFGWPWGDALAVLNDVAPDVRVINLETSITRSDDVDYGKGVHYRMTPENIGCLAVAQPDVCTLANNHVLDFGQRGLRQTCQVLVEAGIAGIGAGRDREEAGQPAIVPVDGACRVVVISVGAQSSGIPPDWRASQETAGVALLPDLSRTTAEAIAERVQPVRARGDVVVVSVHWGSNWGYEIPTTHVDFAHRLIDAGVDLIHGHSSHHPRPIEIYRDKLILYGCGDFIDDYEGISGYEEYRDDLRLLYFASVAPETGRLAHLAIVPMQARKMRLHRATIDDARLLGGILDRTSRRFGSYVELSGDGTLRVLAGGPGHAPGCGSSPLG